LFELCGPATLADIPTYGNTNLIWYDSNGTLLPPPLEDYPLADGEIYYVAQSGGGGCESTLQTELIISITTDKPKKPLVETPQYFCDGALVGNLVKPNNQILWYAEESGGEPLKEDTKLITGTYFAAQKAGDCESEERTEVKVFIDKYPKPVVAPTQTICGMTNPTLGDLTVIGTGIRWYEKEDDNIPLPLDTPITDGEKYWVAQSLGNCESDRVEVTIMAKCYKPYGTVFPFVHTNDPVYNSLFETTAKLYIMPPETILDKINYIRNQNPIQTAIVTYYDCENDTIIGAPKDPGTIGATNNFGEPIRWDAIGISFPGVPNTTLLTETDNCTFKPIGKYKFTDVAPGKYIMAITRKGFLVRYGVITVAGDNYLGHREILGGDVNGDLKINGEDLSVIRTKISSYGNTMYNPGYDLCGSKSVSPNELSIIRTNNNADTTIYKETEDWINP
jgi:hypothetical protein